MNIVNVDLDNTLIFSDKHDIGRDRINVEIYKGAPISYITPNTQKLLKELKELALIVPTTTRTQEQYERIHLNVGLIKYALVCNGGVLLENGIPNEQWECETREMIAVSLNELIRGKLLLENDSRTVFDVRFVNDMFVFTKTEAPEDVVHELEEKLDSSLVDVFSNGIKIYILPKNLTKGKACIRFKNWIHGNHIYSAGDSGFDVSMIECADYSVVPPGFVEKYGIGSDVIETTGKKVFSEEMLEIVKTLILLRR